MKAIVMCLAALLAGCSLYPFRALDEAEGAMTPLAYLSAASQSVGALAFRVGQAERRGLVSERIEEQVLDQLERAAEIIGKANVAIGAGEEIATGVIAHNVRGYLQSARDYLRTHGLAVRPEEPLIR